MPTPFLITPKEYLLPQENGIDLPLSQFSGWKIAATEDEINHQEGPIDIPDSQKGGNVLLLPIAVKQIFGKRMNRPGF